MTTLRTFQVLYYVQSSVIIPAYFCCATQNEIEEIHTREVNRQRAAASALASESERAKAKSSKPKQDTLTSAQPAHVEQVVESDLEYELQTLRVSH